MLSLKVSQEGKRSRDVTTKTCKMVPPAPKHAPAADHDIVLSILSGTTSNDPGFSLGVAQLQLSSNSHLSFQENNGFRLFRLIPLGRHSGGAQPRERLQPS
jgi:hypothetical protein